jgi:DNA-binding NarL/FixJ family response regulator
MRPVAATEIRPGRGLTHFNQNLYLTIKKISSILPLEEITMPKYRIILADDHVLVREGIKRILQEDPKLTVVDETSDGLELLRLLEEITPDMVILDISMPGLGGIEAIRIIKELYPQIKVLVLTMHKSKEYLYVAMDNGADGYLVKDDANDILHSAIKTIRRGKTFISPLIFG